MDAISLVKELVGKKAILEYKPRHPADVMSTWADIGKASNLLGWRPMYSLERGMSNLVGWYRENRTWAQDIRTGE